MSRSRRDHGEKRSERRMFMPLERLRAYLYEWLVNTPMPLNLVFVRHGESEGNVANQMIRDGRYDEIPVGLRGYPGWKWRLSERGEQQAVACGNYLRMAYPRGFDAGYTSSFVRARQTTGLIGEIGSHPPLQWKPSLILRERDYGRLDTIPRPEDLERHLKYLEGRTEDRTSWPPPGGESLDRVQTTRADRYFGTQHRHHSLHSSIGVSHGDFITASLLALCRIQNDEFMERKARKDPLFHIENCQVVEFTRIDPETGRISDHLDWVRSVCPWDKKWPESPCAVWMPIVRRKYTAAELLVDAKKFPKYF